MEVGGQHDHEVVPMKLCLLVCVMMVPVLIDSNLVTDRQQLLLHMPCGNTFFQMVAVELSQLTF